MDFVDFVDFDKRTGAVSGHYRNTTERSGARSGRSRSGNGAESGGYRNTRLERRAAFSPAPLSLTCSVITGTIITMWSGPVRCLPFTESRRESKKYSTLVIVKVAQIVGKNSYIFVFKHTHSP